jgi:creatinine amidohydrolase/Fe(II)-dependent formamide hydrolase-like protein
MLHVAPELVDMELARRAPPPPRRRRFGPRDAQSQAAGPDDAGGPGLATPEKGERLYKMIYDRIATRVLESAA